MKSLGVSKATSEVSLTRSQKVALLQIDLLQSRKSQTRVHRTVPLPIVHPVLLDEVIVTA
jgi:hypothetical protein